MVCISCQVTYSPDNTPEIPDMQEVMNNEIQGEGMVVWKDIEGGFFGIETKTGSKYYPLSPLNQELQVDGMAVKFILKPEPEIVTTVMWGTPVSVISIERINP